MYPPQTQRLSRWRPKQGLFVWIFCNSRMWLRWEITKCTFSSGSKTLLLGSSRGQWLQHETAIAVKQTIHLDRRCDCSVKILKLAHRESGEAQPRYCETAYQFPWFWYWCHHNVHALRWNQKCTHQTWSHKVVIVKQLAASYLPHTCNLSICCPLPSNREQK